MPRWCTVCRHVLVERIDEELLRGVPLRDIAERYRLSATALHRHKRSHLPEVLRQHKEQQDSLRAESLTEQMEQLRRKAESLMLRAERAGDLRTALMAIRELRGLLELALRASEFTSEVEIAND